MENLNKLRKQLAEARPENCCSGSIMVKHGKGESHVLDAIERGEAHAISVANGLFGTGPYTHAYKFLNEDLGKRVAETTLKGFGRR